MSSILPGRLVMMITRSDRNTASGIEWVISKTVFRLSSPDALKLQVHVLARHGVESAERLVHQQDRRIVDKRTADRDPLLHAAG